MKLKLLNKLKALQVEVLLVVCGIVDFVDCAMDFCEKFSFDVWYLSQILMIYG